MKLKPKQTVKNPKALIYRRFTRIETSSNYETLYYTYDAHYWSFDIELENFVEIPASEVPTSANVINITMQLPSGGLTEVPLPILQYKGKYFQYAPINNVPNWAEYTTPPYPNLLSAAFGNIARYQTNNYYFAGAFDYIIKGAQEGGTTQFIKGNITPLTSFSIKYYSDTANLQNDDLLVIGKHLYSVENPETSFKQQPKPYAIHYVTLNSIL